MGRLGLALALLIGFAAPAFAYKIRLPPPEPRIVSLPEPRIVSAYLEIEDQRTSTGLYDVYLLQLEASFRTGVLDPTRIAQVRIAIRDQTGHESTITTTPDHLQLQRPGLVSPVGIVTLYVSTVDERGTESPRARVSVVAHRHHAIRCGNPLFIIGMVFGAVFGILLMLGVLFKMRATEAERARVRSATEPTALPQPAAEDYIRTVALRSLLAIVVVAAIVVASIGADMLLVPIFGSPLLLAIGLAAILRVVNAGRAIALLHGPDARATTRHDQLEVTACDRHVTLRSSPRLVERARSRALPRATL